MTTGTTDRVGKAGLRGLDCTGGGARNVPFYCMPYCLKSMDSAGS